MAHRGMPLTEARTAMLERVPLRPTEVVSLASALGRVLARDCYALRDLPPEARSRMDGFAAASSDLETARPECPAVLWIRPEVGAAGHVSQSGLASGETVRILTGAPLPAGADVVVPDEEVRLQQSNVVIERPFAAGDWVQPVGADAGRGEPIGRAGMVLSPDLLSMLASFGDATVEVFKRPLVGLLGTGDELLELGEPLSGPAHYCNSRYLLQWLVEAHGGAPLALGNARDDAAAVAEALDRRTVDAVISTGGTGFGDRDVVLDAWQVLGITVVFRRLDFSPGKLSAFGTNDGRGYLALPGVPWAAEAVFLELGVPWLRALTGAAFEPLRKLPAVLTSVLPNTRPTARLVQGQLDTTTVPLHFSPMIGGPRSTYARISARNSYVVVPAATTLEKGCIVEVGLYDLRLNQPIPYS